MNRSTYGPKTITQSLNRIQSEKSILSSLPSFSNHLSTCSIFWHQLPSRHSFSQSPRPPAHARASAPMREPARALALNTTKSSPDGPATGDGPRSTSRGPRQGCSMTEGLPSAATHNLPGSSSWRTATNLFGRPLCLRAFVV
jgi:hypothetical protein